MSAAAPAAQIRPAAAVAGPDASWGGGAVLVVPTAGLLAMVAAVVVVNEVNQLWSLVFAMGLAIIATLCVVATIMRMLGGEDD